VGRTPAIFSISPTKRLLDAVKRDYSPLQRVQRGGKLRLVIESEELEHRLISQAIDKLREMDRTLHPEESRLTQKSGYIDRTSFESLMI